MRYKTTGKKKIEPFGLPCRKTIYQTREDAEDMIRHITETRTGRGIRAYKCEICGFWHITSKSK